MSPLTQQTRHVGNPMATYREDGPRTQRDGLRLYLTPGKSFVSGCHFLSQDSKAFQGEGPNPQPESHR